MPKKHRSIVIVPPGVSPVRGVRIRISLFILAALVLLITGAAGLFFPFQRFSIDQQTSSRRRNMQRRNIQLLQNIRSIRTSLGHLTRKLDALSSHVTRVDSFTSFILPDSEGPSHAGGQANISPDRVGAILTGIEDTEAFVSFFTRMLCKNTNVLARLPVVPPLFGDYYESTTYGMARDPFTHTSKMHHGIDYVAEPGTPVRAPAYGRVIAVTRDNLWGIKVEIAHSYGFSTVYAHLGSHSVHMQQKVAKGDVIGTVGSSGLVTGPHLHYEVHVKNSSLDPRQLMFPLLERDDTLHVDQFDFTRPSSRG